MTANGRHMATNEILANGQKGKCGKAFITLRKRRLTPRIMVFDLNNIRNVNNLKAVYSFMLINSILHEHIQL